MSDKPLQMEIETGLIKAKMPKLDDLATPDDNTDLNATNARHGLLLKLIDDTTKFLRSDGGWQVPAGGGPTIVRKTADERVNNSNVLQNDDHLFFAVGANEIWGFTMVLQWNSPIAPDIKFAITVPAAATIAFTSIHKAAGGTTWIQQVVLASGTAISLEGNSAQDWMSVLDGIVVNGANAGNVQLQWAQNTATVADTIVRANSHIIAHKLG